MVFKEVLGINGRAPPFAFVVETQMPAAELVALHVGIVAVARVAAAGDKGVEEVFRAVPHLYIFAREVAAVVGSAPHVPRLTAELGVHLESAGKGEGEFVRIADFQETGFAVEERVVGIGHARGVELVLPSVVGEHAVSHVPFER